MTAKFTVTKLIEHAERAFNQYGDIQIAIKIDDMCIVPITEVGIAGHDPENRTTENTFLCFSGSPAEEEPVVE